MAEMTLFEKILAGKIPSKLVYEDDLCAAFRDINPQAPTHILIVPRKPIPAIADVESEDEAVLGRLLRAARLIAESEKLDRGYRLVINCGDHGQQTVPHLHVHLIGGRQLSWPPG